MAGGERVASIGQDGIHCCTSPVDQAPRRVPGAARIQQTVTAFRDRHPDAPEVAGRAAAQKVTQFRDRRDASAHGRSSSAVMTGILRPTDPG